MLMGSPDAQAQQRRYRVELLVFWHLDQAPEPEYGRQLTDYSAALDLLAPDPDGDPGEDQKAATPGPATEEGLVADPNAVVWVETPSETMQLAWRRLRSSSGYRPELYFSWEQSNQRPFPLLRVHDAAVVLEQNPYAELRPDTQVPQQPGLNTAAGSAAPMTEPIPYYRIDGTASFRKTRYLHLDLDLEFRTPARGPAPAAGEMTGPQTTSAEPAFEVHALQQSRRVQTREMEYFDGPVFGVLALVTRLDAKADDAPLGAPDAADAGAAGLELPPTADESQLND